MLRHDPFYIRRNWGSERGRGLACAQIHRNKTWWGLDSDSDGGWWMRRGGSGCRGLSPTPSSFSRHRLTPGSRLWRCDLVTTGRPRSSGRPICHVTLVGREHQDERRPGRRGQVWQGDPRAIAGRGDGGGGGPQARERGHLQRLGSGRVDSAVRSLADTLLMA